MALKTNPPGSCDSTVTLHLNTATVIEVERTVQMCSEGSYNVYGDSLTTGGFYQKTRPGPFGCDSLIKLYLSAETGGTVVSSALVLMEEIARARYPTAEWNIYGAQASDGDNWHHDSGRCREILANKILPLCRYFAYVQVAEEEQNLWDEYAALAAESKAFAVRKAVEASQIYPVFRDLFKKEGTTA